MEIVSGYESALMISGDLALHFAPAIEEHTIPSLIISLRSYRSTTFRIIDHGRNSMSELSIIKAFLNCVFRFQKAIKKVRAVQRLRRTRGFAFSQTETAGQQDQARLIRAYDTSKSHRRPTGL